MQGSLDNHHLEFSNEGGEVQSILPYGNWELNGPYLAEPRNPRVIYAPQVGFVGFVRRLRLG